MNKKLTNIINIMMMIISITIKHESCIMHLNRYIVQEQWHADTTTCTDTGTLIISRRFTNTST